MSPSLPRLQRSCLAFLGTIILAQLILLQGGEAFVSISLLPKLCKQSSFALPVLSKWECESLSLRSRRIQMKDSPLYSKKKIDSGSSRKDGGGNAKDGRNWIEKTSPSGTGDSNKGGLVDEYSLGIDGHNFQIGPLSQKFYEALMNAAKKRFPGGDVPEEIIPVYTAFAMDLSAKEATKMALSENGLEMKTREESLDSETGMPGAWGVVEDVQVLDESDQSAVVSTFDTIDDVVKSGKWKPGVPFSFVVRNVKAELKTIDLKTLLQSLNMEDMMDDMSDEDEDGDYDDDQDDGDDDGSNSTALENSKLQKVTYDPAKVVSLKALGRDCEDRSNAVPTHAAAVGFAGGVGQGYGILSRELLRDETLSSEICQQVIDALTQHGCLVVDVGDGSDGEQKLSEMWATTERFFDTVNGKGGPPQLPPMTAVEGAGSRHAVVGYASYDEEGMQFLETRIRRSDGVIVPQEVDEILGPDGVEAMAESQAVMADVGKDVVRIVTSGVLGEMGLDVGVAEVQRAATLLANELLDDGKPVFGDGSKASVEDTDVNMSPHRMCRYTDTKPDKQSDASAKEIFGAHTDTSFITAVPVAAVSGLEVYDSAAGAWIRPELMARRHWENEQLEEGGDPSASTSASGKQWHCRYIVLVPGELLQLVTGGTVPAAPHRVVAITGGQSRLSAPVLLRARPKARMDLSRYYGTRNVGPLLMDAEGMTMEDIHDSMQPGSY